MSSDSDTSDHQLQQIGFGKAFQDEIIKILSHSTMFDNFSPEELTTMSKYLQAYNAPKNVLVFKEGERTGHMCILAKGKLDVFKKTDDGNRKHLAVVREGKTIGEMSVIDGMPYSATVIASEPSTLIFLTKGNFIRITEDHSRLGIKIFWKISQLLSLRLRQTSGKLIDLL